MLSFGVQEMWARLHWFSFHYTCLPRGRVQERDSGILGSFVLDFVKGLQNTVTALCENQIPVTCDQTAIGPLDGASSASGMLSPSLV